jgi:SAM-dependent methyltransferase
MFVVVSSYQHPCTLGIVIAVLLLSILYGSQRQSKPYPLPTDMAQKRKNDLLLLPPRYECPEAANLVEKENQHSEWYNAVSQRIMETSVTDFLEKFRDTEFDHWGRSYNQVKGGMFAWKSQRQRFSELRNGSSIYESACGIGLNLYMTLEILYETHGISNLIVYGNEYVPESVKIARTIFQEQHSPNSTHRPRHGGRLGSICVGDSVQLSYVPANALDLVYTGYISPLFNPLQWTNGTVESNFELYMEHCHHHTVHDMELAKQAQQIQNDWYAKWVGEMIRIAKPGAPVIIEQVSFP